MTANLNAYRHAWRHFVEDVAEAAGTAAPAGTDIAKRARDAAKWTVPSAEPSDIALCGALGSMTYAYSKASTAGQRRELAGPLLTWCALVRQVLGVDPRPSAPAFRADIDG